MELTVLVDNNTLTDRYLLGEPGLALFLRDQGHCTLFDCGYSGVLVANAGRLDIDLRRLNAVVLSHGHLDHTWGLSHLAAHYVAGAMEGRPAVRPALFAHPEALAPRQADGQPIGPLLAADALAGFFDLRLTRQPVRLTDRLVFLGEIPRRHPGDATAPIGLRQTPDGPVPDTLPDDTALAWLGRDGLVVVTGCSHAGIRNIVDHAREVTGEKRVAAVIGGLHLLDAAPDRLAAVSDFLRDRGVAALYPCHCTDLAAKTALAVAVPVHEVGVGLTLAFP